MRTWRCRMWFIVVLIAVLQLSSCANSKFFFGENLLNPSIYYKPTIVIKGSKCDGDQSVDMRSPKNEFLVTLCKSDFAECVMQGSCFVVEESIIRSFNYYARGPDSIPRFVEVALNTCPYGYGALDTCLDPFYSVAADLNFHKVGEVIFVPRIVGIKMPDGELHDGYFIIRDSGARIQGPSRFDFFTGFYSHKVKENTLARLGFDDKNNQFEFRLGTAEETILIKKKRRYPGLKNSLL